MVEQKLTTTRAKLEILQEQLRLKRLELQAAEQELALEQDNFEARVVIAYKTDDLTYIDVVLASTSFEDLVSRMSVVRDLIGGNNELVGGLETTRDKVAREKQTIAEKENGVHQAVNDLQAQSDQLAALRAAQAAQKAASFAMRKQKNTRLSAVENDLALLEQQENQLLAESNALAGVINGSSGNGVGTGSMMWPVNGPVDVALRVSHPPDPRLSQAPHRPRLRRGVRHAHPRRRQRRRHLRHLDGRLRQRDHHRSRARHLDALRSPVVAGRGHRRAW